VNGFEVHEYVMRPYLTFYDERGDVIDKILLTPDKVAIPLQATYLTYEMDVRQADKSEDDGDVR
jgi:hypothetical protein